MEPSFSRDESVSSSSESRDESDWQGYTSSLNSTPPPTLADIDRWRYHTDLENFGKSLQHAVNAVFPNDTNSRYTKVSVLMVSWEDEDPKLPVSLEINKLYDVFRGNYGYETERWSIPDENSHWMLTQKIMEFVKPVKESKSHLKIVYYAGHARLTETRLLVWTSWRNNRRAKCPMVKWGGIQTILEETPSDVLILLDTCASGTANASEGNGVNELISACAFNETANGAGPYSFTSALVTELRLLSRKPFISVGELYKKIFFRTQCRMPEEMYTDGTHKERHPAPIHLLLSCSDSTPRGIQLPTNVRHQISRSNNVPKSWAQVAASTLPVQKSHPANHQNIDQGMLSSSSQRPIRQSFGATLQAPRLLFSVRLRDTFQPGESMIDLFTEWIRNIPVIADQMSVEAMYDSRSTIVFLSLPLSIAAYLPRDPSITCLGPVTSMNRMAKSEERTQKVEIELPRRHARQDPDSRTSTGAQNSTRKPSGHQHHIRSRDSIQPMNFYTSSRSQVRSGSAHSSISSRNTTYSRESSNLRSHARHVCG